MLFSAPWFSSFPSNISRHSPSRCGSWRLGKRTCIVIAPSPLSHQRVASKDGNSIFGRPPIAPNVLTAVHNTLELQNTASPRGNSWPKRAQYENLIFGHPSITCTELASRYALLPCYSPLPSQQCIDPIQFLGVRQSLSTRQLSCANFGIQPVPRNPDALRALKMKIQFLAVRRSLSEN